jgi:hypothetical protein
VGIHSIHKRAAQLMCGLLLAFAVGSASAQQLVSSNSSDGALRQQASGLHALDISADGRYVLFSNYSTIQRAFGGDPGPYAENCRIWRKDRQTGKLLKVFESDPDGFEFCSGAKLSADGNRVAASPTGPAGPCTAITMPDGFAGFDCGEVTTLLIRDLATGAIEKAVHQWLPYAADLGRIDAGSPGSSVRYGGAQIFSLSADATVAVLAHLAVLDGYTQMVYSVADAHMNTLDSLAVQKAIETDSVRISSVALSTDGARLAVGAWVSSLCQPDSTSTSCQPPPGCEGIYSSYWCFGYPRYEPAIHRIYIVDRLSGAVNVPAALDNLPQGTTLGANAWSVDGNYLSWIEVPKFPICGKYSGGTIGCTPEVSCAGQECELTLKRYNFSSSRIRTRQTVFDPETLSLCSPYAYDRSVLAVTRLNCTPQLSRDGNRLLFGRAVRHPFGGDWQPDIFSHATVCISKASLDSPGMEPELIECPSSGPQLPYDLGSAEYSAPVNWYLQDLRTGHTALVSITDAGQLFQSNGVLLADNGRAAVFSSRDPRLNNLLPNANQYDESQLPEGCFWSPAGSSSNLLVATNDNTSVSTNMPSAPEIPGFPDSGYEVPEFYEYPETPVFCPVSYPVLPANLYALDIGRGVNLAGMTFGGFGSGTVPIQTWIANPGRHRATMVDVDITIKGLGDGGRVRVAEDTPCEIYPATDAASDSSVLLRCELPALAPLAFQQLRWTISSDKLAFVQIDTKISSNERETLPANNTTTAFTALLPRGGMFNWFGAVR